MTKNTNENNRLSAEMATVLQLLKSALFGYAYQPMHEGVSLAGVFEECKSQAVEALCYPVIEPYLDDELKKVWRTRYRKRVLSNIMVEEEHAHVARLMEANNIPYVIMKGTCAAKFYPSPELRNLGDVDFLINQEDMARCEAAILSESFKEKEEAEVNHCHIAYKKGDIIWEMHWEPNGIPNNEKGTLIRQYLSDMISSSELYQNDDYSFRITNDFHNGMIQLIHTATHLINTGVGLRHICDWAMFTAAFDNDTFIAMFEKPLNEIGLWHFAQMLTLLSVKYLGCPARAWAGSAEDTVLEKMILDVFGSGNFGAKDVQRINQAKLMTDRDNGNTKSGSPLKQLIKSVNYKTKTIYPFFAKYRVLLPCGWVIVIIRQIFRIIRGKRPSIHMNDVISGAKERAELYVNLKLYE